MYVCVCSAEPRRIIVSSYYTLLGAAGNQLFKACRPSV